MKETVWISDDLNLPDKSYVEGWGESVRDTERGPFGKRIKNQGEIM